MTRDCPLCRRPLPADTTVTVTVEPPAIRVGIRAARVPPQTAELLECLAANLGDLVPWPSLIAYLWPAGRRPRDPREAIRALIRDARADLADLGLECVKVWGTGYLLRRTHP